MSERENKTSQPSLQQHVLKAGLLGGLLNGCVIFLILGVALVLGLWLDSGSDRRVYTFILILASVPVTMVAVYLIGRRFSAWMAPPKMDIEPGQDESLEDADSGND
ncbi:MAG: hypothetical protein IH629_03495 [Thermoleophilia bacterium]|nr:hypothetical protein [Thermoleophilia bacterium]